MLNTVKRGEMGSNGVKQAQLESNGVKWAQVGSSTFLKVKRCCVHITLWSTHVPPMVHIVQDLATSCIRHECVCICVTIYLAWSCKGHNVYLSEMIITKDLFNMAEWNPMSNNIEGRGSIF